MSKLTVAVVCDFWEKHFRSSDKDRMLPRVRKLREELGSVPMCQLRRRQIWEAFGGRTWAYRRNSLEVVKRVFSYAVEPRESGDGPTPAPVLPRADNPLEGVVVNLSVNTSSWGATGPAPELVRQMTDESEEAWEEANRRQDGAGRAAWPEWLPYPGDDAVAAVPWGEFGLLARDPRADAWGRPPDGLSAILAAARECYGHLTHALARVACDRHEFGEDDPRELVRELVDAGLLDQFGPDSYGLTDAGLVAAASAVPPAAEDWRPAGEPHAWAATVADFCRRHGLPQLATLFGVWAGRLPAAGPYRRQYLLHTGRLCEALAGIGGQHTPPALTLWSRAGTDWSRVGRAAERAAAPQPRAATTKKTAEDELIASLGDPVAAAALADWYEERGLAGASAAVRALDWSAASSRLAEANAEHRRGRLAMADLLAACRMAWDGGEGGGLKGRRHVVRRADVRRGLSAAWVRGTLPRDGRAFRSADPRFTLALAVRVKDHVALDVAVVVEREHFSGTTDPARGWPDELDAEPRQSEWASVDANRLRSQQARWWRRMREWAERRLAS